MWLVVEVWNDLWLAANAIGIIIMLVEVFKHFTE